MRTIVAVALLFGLGVLGCASPEQIAEGARRHSVAAATARANGDYNRAAAEHRAAIRQWAKACERAQIVYGSSSYLSYCNYRP
jgi:hypothetical protein